MVIISLYLRINKAHNGLLSINGAEFKCGSCSNTCSARFRLGLFGVTLQKLRDWCENRLYSLHTPQPPWSLCSSWSAKLLQKSKVPRRATFISTADQQNENAGSDGNLLWCINIVRSLKAKCICIIIFVKAPSQRVLGPLWKLSHRKVSISWPKH